MPEVEIHTDGSARGNPGPGGYGVVLRYGEHSKELSGGFRRTTNNRMELLAVIIALEALKFPCRVKLFSDSQYVVKSIKGNTVGRWKANGWRRLGKKAKIKNVDLWERYLTAAQNHELEVAWIEGHAGHADNERCDQLAVKAAQSKKLQEDTGYVGAAEPEPMLFQVARDSEPDDEETDETCRKCNGRLVRRRPAKHRANAAFYYEYYHSCMKCGTRFMVEEAKRFA